VTTFDNQVHFVTVPGRLPGVSEGMTLSEFADYLHTQIPNINMAINLDGGASSRISIKRINAAGESVIETFNYSGSQRDPIPYPVGAILSFVQTQPSAVVPFALDPPHRNHFQGKRSKRRMEKRRMKKRKMKKTRSVFKGNSRR
jgi:hypothetical protein